MGKLCVNIIGPQILFGEERPKSIIKFGTVINPVAGWFQFRSAYNDETVVIITKLDIL